MALEQDEFLRQFAVDPALRADPLARSRHAALTARASVCSYCGVGCSYTVRTDEKGVDRVSPLSALGLCVKGKTSLLTGGDVPRRERLAQRGIPDDRIRVPMLRGHDGRMHEVSWEEALDRAAWLFLHAREWVAPEAVAIYGNGQKTMETIWMASLYKLVFRLPTVGANSEHCLASAGAAHELNFGNEASFTWKEFDELLECDVAVLHGTNPLITFPQAYDKLKRNERAVKVVIDPVRTDTVSDLQASDPRTLHIRFRQGGDVMLNLAVSRVIFEEGWQDTEYLLRVVSPESLAAFRALCAQERCAPEAVAKRIALDDDAAELAATIRRYAALLAKPSPDGTRPRAAFVSSMGINQSTGSYGFSTNLNLLLLTGNVGRRGAGSMRIAGQSNATSELMLGFNGRRLVFNLDPENAQHRAELARVLDLPERNIPETKGTSVARMSEDDRLYCFLFLGTQMTRNMPRLGHWMRRLGRAFNVIIDSFLADGVLEWADVLLPALTYTERIGVIQRGDRTLQLQQRVTEPPPLAWSDEQILVRLALAIAKRLRDPDTAALNDLDPDVVERTFARYLDAHGNVDAAQVFDHMVSVSRELNVYCRLEDTDGTPISHALLRERAGLGVQWQGNGRYAAAHESQETADVFPRLHYGDTQRASLVRPPDHFLAELEQQLEPGTLSLISGRGRPGKKPLTYVARYNSGIKTLPITGRAQSGYDIEIHPREAARHSFSDGQVVRLTSQHGAVVGKVSYNDRIPCGAAFIDFVPGEINRLTDYLDADRFTKQSLIKRTPVRIQGLTGAEAILWDRPDVTALCAVIMRLYADFRATYATDADWLKLQRQEPDAVAWLPARVLREPVTPEEHALAEAVGAMIAFIQRYVSDNAYRAGGAALLRALDPSCRHQLLVVLLPLLRRFDYQSALHTLLADIVGGVQLLDEHGTLVSVDLLSAHKSAVLEFKEEIVAIQLYIAARRGLELLFGKGAVVPRADLAFVSGIAIPCAGDVPAHFLGLSPAHLSSDRMIHSRAIGLGAMIVIDRRNKRAVRINVHTGVLPKDRELTTLRGLVINRKRGASGREHARFFDRLGELVVDYVRTGDDNFELFGPVSFDWEEYVKKLAIAPAARTDFCAYLLQQRISPGLARALVGLGVLDSNKDSELLSQIEAVAAGAALPEGQTSRSTEAQCDARPLHARVMHVVNTVISPILSNDGGKLDILDIDEASGGLSVRFVGSCANCPYSLLSMEQLVKPSLLAIRGVTKVSHRAQMRQSEL
jgi:anaerobic selenocysteine-containing dehydrogenase/Fe-S cluster biogenesis protein NfuA